MSAGIDSHALMLLRLHDSVKRTLVVSKSGSSQISFETSGKVLPNLLAPQFLHLSVCTSKNNELT